MYYIHQHKFIRMKLVQFGLVVGATILSSITAQAQNVDEIIAKHLQAIGGKEKIKQIKSLYMESALDVMNNPATGTTYILNGKGFRQDIDFQGQKIVQVITDKEGWAINPMMGSEEPQALPEDQHKATKDQVNIGGVLVDYPANGAKAEYQGKEGNTHKVKVTSADKRESTYFIDATTFYITKAVVKTSAGGQEGEVTTTFSDYKKTDYGYVVPFTTAVDTGMMQIGVTLNKVEINKEIDPKLFQKP